MIGQGEKIIKIEIENKVGKIICLMSVFLGSMGGVCG